MRIVYHHRTRGTDAQRVHILEIVRAFRKLGHEVEIVSLVRTDCAPHDPQKEAGEALWKRCVRRIPFGYEMAQLGYNFIGLPLLLFKLLSRRFDFIYERYSLLNFSGVLAARLFRLPIILEVNSPLALEQRRENDIRAYRLAQWAEHAICNSATKVVAVSSPLRRILMEFGVAAHKIVVMPNGVNPGHFRHKDEAELRHSLRLDGKTVIGFIGWFRRWHGLELLLEAFHRSGLVQRNAVLLLVGDGPAMPPLKEYVERNRLQESILFMGPLEHERIPDYLDLFDIAVQPAANEYCSPMKVLEYMALGKAIVAPRQENIQELLLEGSEALLFTPGNAEELGSALAALTADPQRARRMGRRSLAAIREKDFLWEKNASRVVELVQKAAPQQAETGGARPLSVQQPDERL